MFLTIMYAIYVFFIFSTSALIFVLPGLLLRLAGLRKIADTIIRFAAEIAPKLLIWGSGSRVEIRGLEHYPVWREPGRYCIVANHQSYFDILLILGFLPGYVSFVAKKELFRVPLLNIWMFGLGCIKLDRSSPRASIKAIEQGIQKIREGLPLLIFPEGTRSRSNRVGEFKSGSLKLATRSEAIIVPLTVEGTADIYEARGRIGSSRVVLTVHPPVPTRGLEDEEKRTLASRLRDTILQAGESLVSKEGL